MIIASQARAFFDSWLERFMTWDDFVQAVRSDSLPEFGGDHGTAIRQITTWLGGAAKAPNNYANIVKYGVGATILHRFTGRGRRSSYVSLLKWLIPVTNSTTAANL